MMQMCFYMVNTFTHKRIECRDVSRQRLVKDVRTRYRTQPFRRNCMTSIANCHTPSCMNTLVCTIPLIKAVFSLTQWLITDLNKQSCGGKTVLSEEEMSLNINQSSLHATTLEHASLLGSRLDSCLYIYSEF